MAVDTAVRWFVMTLRDERRFQEWLKEENARRLSEGRAVVEPFFPRDYLRADTTVAADFRHIVFLKASAADVDALATGLRTQDARIRLRYYLDTDRQRATVPARRMQAFLEACTRHAGQVELVPAVSSIEATDRVRIKSGPFAGQEATVASVRLDRGAIHLELRLQLLAGVVSIRMSNVTKSQVEVIDRREDDPVRTDFIEYTQNHLLNILDHRVRRVADAGVNRRDADMLTRLYRYRYHDVRHESARLHFRALMLICAHLCRHTAEETALREELLGQLDIMNSRSASKAATDTRTYLWIALYISTHAPQYREAAKQYVREHQPKSAKLRRFVALIRKGVRV